MGTWSLAGNALATTPNSFLGTTDNTALVIHTGNPTTERLRVAASGNVGIGTATPGRMLEVAAADSNTGIKITGNTSNRSWLMAVGVAAGDGKLAFYDYGTAAHRLIIDTNGNIGIGEPNPNYPLHLPPGKALRIEGGTNAADATDYFSFGGNGSFGIDAPGVVNGRFVVSNSGNVGIGVPNPAYKLQINGDIGVIGAGQYQGSTGGATIEPGLLAANLNAGGQFGPVVALTNTGGGVNTTVAVDFYTFDPGEGSGPNHETTPSAEIAAIDVGNFANDIVFRGNQPGAPNQSLQERMRITSTGNVTIPGDIVLTGADCAEQFDVSEADVPEAGTVVVIDEGGVLRESRGAYDKKVAGVVSGAGEYKHGILLDRRPESECRVPVALVGKVYCKVDAQQSPVDVGDLLTTSSTPGHAMKATEPAKAFGATIGKALRALPSGVGLIPILVALQ